jgi:CHAT domain-containing protein
MFDAYVDFLIRSNKVYAALTVTETIRAQTLEEGLAATTTPGRAIDPRAIAKQSGATILSYWLGRERSFLWVITPASVTAHALPPDTKIETEVERYRRDLEETRPTLELSGARGEALFRMLAAPASIGKDSRVIVIADGRLHALNFETLVAPSPRRYWIEDVIVTNASSLQLLARKRTARSAAAAMLLVGNPPASEFPPLPRAGEEMASIARHFDRRTILAGAKATPSAYRRATPEKFDFVHFVAHGVATRKRPLDSAVILARDANGHKLFARDIVLQRLSARLVTISSCHGAGTRTFSGEGLVGLAWAFLGAGAEQVIAALWEVNDSATPELMDRMYAGIRAGRDPAVALRDAKLTLVRGKGAYRKAVYWAPFVLYSGS